MLSRLLFIFMGLVGLSTTLFAQIMPVPSMPGRNPIIPTIENIAFTVKDVRKLRMLLKGDVLINQGPRDALFVEGLHDALKQIRADVVGGVLTIRYKGTQDPRLSQIDYAHPMIYRLTVTNLQGIEMTSGTVQSTEIRTSAPFSLIFGGDAVAQLSIFSKEVRAQVSGVAQVQILNGSTGNQRVMTKNRGRYLGQLMRSENTDVDVNDNSQAFVHARLVLDGDVRDDGELFYVGIPQSNQVNLHDLGKMTSIPQQTVTPPPTPQVLPSSPNPHGQGWNSVP